MIELSISGRSEGLAASSNIAMFSARGGSITDLLTHRLHASADIALPFGVLGIWIEALDHTEERVRAEDIEVDSVKKLMKHHTGSVQKLFELTIGNSFYRLSTGEKRLAIARAFSRIAKLVAEEFPGAHGLSLSRLISDSANEYASVSAVEPDNSLKPTPAARLDSGVRPHER